MEERRQYLRTRREMLSVQLAPLPKQGDGAADAPPPPPPGERRQRVGTDLSPKARAAEEGGKAAVRRILAETRPDRRVAEARLISNTFYS